MGRGGGKEEREGEKKGKECEEMRREGQETGKGVVGERVRKRG